MLLACLGKFGKSVVQQRLSIPSITNTPVRSSALRLAFRFGNSACFLACVTPTCSGQQVPVSAPVALPLPAHLTHEVGRSWTVPAVQSCGTGSRGGTLGGHWVGGDLRYRWQYSRHTDAVQSSFIHWTLRLCSVVRCWTNTNKATMSTAHLHSSLRGQPSACLCKLQTREFSPAGRRGPGPSSAP